MLLFNDGFLSDYGKRLIGFAVVFCLVSCGIG